MWIERNARQLSRATLAIRRGVLLILVVAGASWAQAAPHLRTISVTGYAEVRVKPDEVQINFGIETTNANLSAAKEENDARVKRVIAFAKQADIEDRHIQTEYLNIEPRYRPSRDGGMDFLGYFVRRQVSVTLRDPSKFDALLSGILEAGANYVHGIQFRTTELRKYRDEARNQAVRAAREKAEALAAALGAKLGAVDTVSEGQAGGWSSSYRYQPGWGQTAFGAAMASTVTLDSAAPAEGTLAPGQIVVTAQVQVVFQLQ